MGYMHSCLAEEILFCYLLTQLSRDVEIFVREALPHQKILVRLPPSQKAIHLRVASPDTYFLIYRLGS